MSADVDLTGVGSEAMRLANQDGYVGHPAAVQMIARHLMRHPLILKIQERRGVARAERAAHDKARWAVQSVTRNPKEEWRSRIPARIVRYREAADSFPWDGRTGPTDRRVLEAFFVTATFARSDTFRFAAVTIGERTSMSWRTANAATHRLRAHHKIRKVANHGERKGTKFQLAAPDTWNLQHRSCPPAPMLPGLGMRSPDDPLVEKLLRHPAFRNRAFGDDGWLLVHWLHEDEPARARHLAAATGIHYDRVRTVLGRLQRSQIVRTVPDGWVRVSDVELVHLLDELDVSRRSDTVTALPMLQERGTPDWWAVWWGSLEEGNLTRAA
jgi:hypothetical protein